MSWGSVNVASDAWVVRLHRGGGGGRCNRPPLAPFVARKFYFLSPTRISHEIRGSTCLLTMLGASAVPRLGAKRSGADGASPQEAKPIDYVEITLSFLKRSFLLHNWR